MYIHSRKNTTPDTRRPGLKGDGKHHYQQDAPGRAKTASSRQQMHPDQKTQTGSKELDGNKESKQS